MHSELSLRVAFATPFTARAEFSIGLNPGRTTEAQMIKSLSQGVLYEQYTSWVMIGLLRPGDIAIDVGAHVGYYSLLMRTLVGESGLVRAAEPQPESYLSLLGNISRNGYQNVTPSAVAIADRVGKASFETNPRNEGESGLSPTGSQRVNTSTLDQWLADLPRPARLLKLDAEGCEAHILAGGATYFNKQAPDSVICEINPTALARFGSSPDQLRARFREMGYLAYVINVAPSGPYDLCQGAIVSPLGDEQQVDTPVVYNLLFCRPGVVPVGLGL